jgi:hypothetical protein
MRPAFSGSAVRRARAASGAVARAWRYVTSLRWAGDCAAIWDFAFWPLIAAQSLGLFFNLAVLTFGSLAVLMVLFLGVGLAAHSPLSRPDGVIEAAMERWISEKLRAARAKELT